MKITQRALFLGSALLLLSVAASAQSPTAQSSAPTIAAPTVAKSAVVPRVADAAVWNPSAEVLSAARAKCGEADATHIEGCFLSEMKLAGASPEALAFSRGLASTGVIYLRAFRKVARVDVAYIQYAFRANELAGMFLVNGDPSPIDVDDESHYSQSELQKFPAYNALADKFPNASIWPADRENLQLPKVDSTGWGTQTFLVDYILRDGCHACAQIGTATIAFNFDTQGKFQGARLSAVKPVAHDVQTSSGPDFGTAGVEQIRVLAGKEFSITLLANHTTGYSWRLATTLDPATLKQLSNVYNERPSEATVGAPGEEVWTFASVGQGSVPLLFEYVRPFEKDAKPVKTSKFLVNIE